MRTIKMMSACLVAAMAFIACQKENVTLPAGATMKSVEVSLENAVIKTSRGDAGEKIQKGDAVAVKSLKIFLTDDAGNSYEAKTKDGSEAAQTWWSSVDLSNNDLQASFHYVDNGCTKIVAVANLDADISYSDFLAMENLKIDNEQNAGELSLYAESKLTKKEGQHTDINVDGTTYVSDIYEASLTLRPRISRFEVDGFTVKFNATPKYSTIQVTDLLFQNYSPECELASGIVSGSAVQHIANLENQSDVYNWFNDSTKAKEWYWDSFNLIMTKAEPTKDTPKPLAYHIFAGKTVPTMVIKLLADDQPAYLYSRGFYKADGTPVTEFAPGVIYRMNARGEVENDGSIAIDEDDIDPMDRCLEITVEVLDWVVELVFPEF